MNRHAFVVPMTLLATALWAAGQTGIKRAVMGAPSAAPWTVIAHALVAPVFWLGLAVTGLGTAVWIWVLSRSQLSYAAPLAGAASILLLLASSAFILREPIGVTRLLGVLILAIGVALVGWS